VAVLCEVLLYFSMSCCLFCYRPAVNPPKEITDPADKKPDDWDERERYMSSYYQ